METIGKFKQWSFLAGHNKIRSTNNRAIRNDKGHLVEDYLDLATKVAELQFKNRDYMLLFRGQNKDYHVSNDLTSTLRPSLFRSESITPKDIGWSDHLIVQYQKLKLAERILLETFERKDNENIEFIKRHRIIQWAILQHYEVCDTPLLDVTQSLRSAASFASNGNTTNTAFLYVIGIPNLGGAITVSAEAGLQILRLSSVCPPKALRPHIQEGYLLGEYPDMPDFSQKRLYKAFEIDFGRRLIAKFCFNPKTFWKKDAFPKIKKADLFPDSDDPYYKASQIIKNNLKGNGN